MTTSALTQPTATTFRLSALVQLVRGGAIRVPHFQRSFRWDVEDVELLFDSILRGYPVGSVLLWQRPAEADPALRLGALTLDVPARPDALWVVDGQQRITSLVNAVTPEAGESDPRFRLSYDLQTDRVVHDRDRTRLGLIPLPILFDLRTLLGWVPKRPELADRIGDLNEVTTRLQNFELPASIVKAARSEVMQDIFDRMNTSGKKLRRAEIFSALYAAQESKADQALSVAAVGDRLAGDGTFGRIDDNTVLQAVLARRGPDANRDIRREFDGDTRRVSDFPGENQDQALAAGAEAIRRAIGFLQDRVGVPHISFLPYRFLLVVLARFFAHFPDPVARNAELVSRWFWRAALTGPQVFKGNSSAAIRTLSALIVPGRQTESAQSLLAAVDRQGPLPTPTFDRFRTNDSSTKVILCGLWAQGPRSLQTDERLTTTQIDQALESQTTARDLAIEIVAGQKLSEALRPWAANRMISLDPVDVIPAGLAPDPLFEVVGEDRTTRRDVRRSHVVSDAAARLLEQGRFDDFVRERDRDLRTAVAQFLQQRAGIGFESTPPLSDFDFDEDDSVDEDLMK